MALCHLVPFSQTKYFTAVFKPCTYIYAVEYNNVPILCLSISIIGVVIISSHLPEVIKVSHGAPYDWQISHNAPVSNQCDFHIRTYHFHCLSTHARHQGGKYSAVSAYEAVQSVFHWGFYSQPRIIVPNNVCAIYG